MGSSILTLIALRFLYERTSMIGEIQENERDILILDVKIMILLIRFPFVYDSINFSVMIYLVSYYSTSKRNDVVGLVFWLIISLIVLQKDMKV
ncbi:hypothetical protein Hanom_Chr07g00643461 [Helianthus anomalus]